MSFTLGIDYGTNSVRALVVRTRDGKEFGSAVVNYPSGHQGILLDPRDHNLALGCLRERRCSDQQRVRRFLSVACSRQQLLFYFDAAGDRSLRRSRYLLHEEKGRQLADARKPRLPD